MSLRRSPKLTAALLAANRRNAQRSTGPRTAGGKTRARLNSLRHGRRSPLYASFWSALRQNPKNVRSVTQTLLRPEEARHPLFARYIREWGRFWTRYHAYLLTKKRKQKRLVRLLLQLQVAASGEAGSGGGSEGWPMKSGNSKRLGDRDRRQFVPKKRKNNKRGVPPHPKLRAEPECC